MLNSNIEYRISNIASTHVCRLSSFVYVLSFALFIFCSLLAATPALAYKYQGPSAFPNDYPDCPTACQAKCDSSQKINNAGYCKDVNSYCCDSQPKNTCSGTCLPKDACDNSGTGEKCAGELVCCGMLKQTSTDSFLGPAAGQPAQQQTQPAIESTEGRTCKTPAGVLFPCPLGTGTAENISSLIGQIIRWCLGLVGALFFAMFVWGGVLYMTAGSSKRAEEGQKTLVNAAIGMAIVIFSYLFVAWVLNVIGAALS